MTPTDLWTLIQSDAQAKAFVDAGNDRDCAVRCSEIAPVIRKPVPAATLHKKLAGLGKLSGILRVARNFDSPDPPYQQAATLMSLIEQGVEIDLDDPQVPTGAPELVAHGLLDVDDLAALSALADAPQTITADQVSEAAFPHRYPSEVI
jgi:hypothetical protein